jgi:outer membrane protein assembly factor BamB
MRRLTFIASRGLMALVLSTLVRAEARAENWPGWRGPTGVGVSAEQDLPTTWDAKKGDHVLWKAPLGETNGHSSPIVWGDRVFLTTAAKQSHAEEEAKAIPAHFLNCFQLSDGKLLWKTPIEGGQQTAGYAIYATPTPITDGHAVYCWFGSGVAAAVDFDGKLLWRQVRPGPFKLNPGLCSSPALYQDTMLLLCDQGGGGWLQALDKKTGEIKWEQKRPKHSYNNSTPILIHVHGQPQLLIQASNQLQGLDPASGEPIWWCTTNGFGSTPAVSKGLIYSDSGNGENGAVVADDGKGDVTATHLKWDSKKTPSQYSSAVISGDFVYRAQKPGLIECRRLSTGDEVFSERAEGVSVTSSPVATAGGLIYFGNSGRSYVIKASDKFDVVAVNNLNDGDNAASMAVSPGRLIIRGDHWLFCLGKP